jgi:hypothetical protein
MRDPSPDFDEDQPLCALFQVPKSRKRPVRADVGNDVMSPDITSSGESPAASPTHSPSTSADDTASQGDPTPDIDSETSSDASDEVPFVGVHIGVSL